MADGYKLWQVCSKCNGAGTIVLWLPENMGNGSFQAVTCPICGGKKYVFFGWCSADTFPMPSGLPDAP